MRIAIMLTLITAALSFGEGGPSKKLTPLPQELQGGIVPNFFVLAADNKTRFFRDDISNEAKKLGAKRVVLSIFATWCENCKVEFVHLKNNAAALKEKGVLIYLIDAERLAPPFKVSEEGEAVSKLVKEFTENLFPLYFDPNVNLLKNFGIIERNSNTLPLPMIVVMDANLRVLNVFTGAGDDFPQILWEDL